MQKLTKFEIESFARTIIAELSKASYKTYSELKEARKAEILKARQSSKTFLVISEIVQRPIEAFNDWPYAARELAERYEVSPPEICKPSLPVLSEVVASLVVEMTRNGNNIEAAKETVFKAILESLSYE